MTPRSSAREMVGVESRDELQPVPVPPPRPSEHHDEGRDDLPPIPVMDR